MRFIDKVQSRMSDRGVSVELQLIDNGVAWVDVVVDIEVEGTTHRVFKIYPRSWSQEEDKIDYVLQSLDLVFRNLKEYPDHAYALSDKLYYLAYLKYSDKYVLSESFGHLVMDCPVYGSGEQDIANHIELVAISNRAFHANRKVPLSAHSYMMMRTHWVDELSPMRDDSILICPQKRVDHT